MLRLEKWCFDLSFQQATHLSTIRLWSQIGLKNGMIIVANDDKG